MKLVIEKVLNGFIIDLDGRKYVSETGDVEFIIELIKGVFEQPKLKGDSGGREDTD